MTLSEKVVEVDEGFGDISVVEVKDVKEFIKKARELLDESMSGGCDRDYVLGIFDKLAGDKLN